MIVDDAFYVAFGKFRLMLGSIYRNEVVAHSVFTFDDYDAAPRVAEDLCVDPSCWSRRIDRFALFAAVEAFAARALDARVEKLEGDYFDVYALLLADRAAEAAAAFFSERLGAAPGSG